jgi:hypothetical protein
MEVDPGPQLDGGRDRYAEAERVSGAVPRIVVLIVLVGLMLVLMAATHASGVEGCGGG